MSTHRVQSEIVLDVQTAGRLVVQVAVAARPGVMAFGVPRLFGADEQLLDVPLSAVPVGHGGFVYFAFVPTGLVTVRYAAEVHAEYAPLELVLPADELTYLLPSRYCPSDLLVGFAQRHVGTGDDPAETVRRVTDFVAGHLDYVTGSTGPLDTAVDVLLSTQGVCRDYAHLVVALCRALGVPARVVSVYAPGLDPMDFHAVAEVAVGGCWRVVDATRLAPRTGMLRVATGRDAADTAFLTTVDGSVGLVSSTVTATVDGDLPLDDHTDVVWLP